MGWNVVVNAKNLVEAYTWPIGILTRWLRTVAVGAPGVFSRVGLGVFIDPRQGGGSSAIWCGREKRWL
jgi:acyl CoA:acetate/3-ketoacid CoA transferase